MKSLSRAAALLGAGALVLSACGTPPEQSGSDSGAGKGGDFKACMVSDSGGFDDKSFNESGFNGLTTLKEDKGYKVQTAESSSEADFSPNLQNMVQGDCNLIYAVGFLFSQTIKTEAEANPDTHYAIIDSTAQDADGNPTEVDNVKPITFDTAQAAYLAGYVAAGTTKTGTVATYGGAKIPSVTIFMDGFADGVKKYNEVHGTNVKLLGWNKDSQDGSFTGDFDDQTKGKALTEGFISQGADIIMPVAGPVGAGTLAAAKEKDGVMVVWVDSDGVETNPDAKDVIITSVMKEIAAAVETTGTEAAEGKFTNEPYVGTLENGGVGLAPYHEFDSKIPAELKKEVEDLQKQIVSGEIEVTSPASPKH
ncbi:BMP family ABC transporter substrate-binding protein [Dermabacter sp. HMSC06F07]|uniref:BMP family lipoprotein n=1 Tax=Dermabacter TaxID=36739 RepID=UPI0008A3F0D4|nr:BMP family ABC transporter substrate-binding protein [Dermabacter sp. HMSC06F07]MCT1710209.1 BMP family ABC transporter substrate-binding protein [Dermabacter hominis]OFT48613.1 BMP family ABC transporter substrate-binding protein [Dermabacter sp. HMSC06F07]